MGRLGARGCARRVTVCAAGGERQGPRAADFRPTPPEGALDLRVRGAGRPRVGAGTGGPVRAAGVCAGHQGKAREPAFPEASPAFEG